jgi:hypothetical protein
MPWYHWKLALNLPSGHVHRHIFRIRKKHKNIRTFWGKLLDPNYRRKMQKHKSIVCYELKLHTQLTPPPPPEPQPLSSSSATSRCRHQCTKTKTAAATAEARTMVTAATVLGRCLCCHHLVVVVAHHCFLPCNCPLCAIALDLATLAIVLILTCHPCCHCHSSEVALCPLLP